MIGGEKKYVVVTHSCLMYKISIKTHLLYKTEMCRIRGKKCMMVYHSLINFNETHQLKQRYDKQREERERDVVVILTAYNINSNLMKLTS